MNERLGFWIVGFLAEVFSFEMFSPNSSRILFLEETSPLDSWLITQRGTKITGYNGAFFRSRQSFLFYFFPFPYTYNTFLGQRSHFEASPLV